MIYADNAATTRLSRRALDAMMPWLDGEYGNPSSLHQMGRRAQAAIEDARGRMARMLGAEDAREIVFTSGGTEAGNLALRAAAAIGARLGRKHIISTQIEHHAVLNTLKALEREGFEVELLPVDKNGRIFPGQVANAIRHDTILVSVMTANNEIGTVQPVRHIGRICRERGVCFHSDAVQAAGHLSVDVRRDNIDLLSLSAHKFHGPKGAGALYVRRGVGSLYNRSNAEIEPMIHGGGQERGRRAGTENVAGIIGMAEALTEALEGLEGKIERTVALRDRLIGGIERLPGCWLNGGRVLRHPGNASFCFEGVNGESLLLLLDNAGICASAGSACTAGSLDPSHVLRAIGRSDALAHGALRLSIDHNNTEAEIDAIIQAVTSAVNTLRACSPVWNKIHGGKNERL